MIPGKKNVRRPWIPWNAAETTKTLERPNSNCYLLTRSAPTQLEFQRNGIRNFKPNDFARLDGATNWFWASMDPLQGLAGPAAKPTEVILTRLNYQGDLFVVFAED